MKTLFLSEDSEVTDLVVLETALGELARVVEHASLAELEHDLSLEMRGRVVEKRGAVEVRFCRGRVLLFEEQTDDADVHLELVLDGAGEERSG